jgi:DNA-binding NtrC family response regulator
MRTVLVVDDERVIREGLRRLLSSEGYRVLTACNGQEALDVLRSENIDAVLCDLKMPVKGAIEVLEESKAESREVPIIILTGQGTIASAVESREKGAYAFITKPFRADCVLMLVKCATENLPTPPKPPGIP